MASVFLLSLFQSITEFMFFKKDFMNSLLIFRQEGKGGRGRKTSRCGCLLRTPYWGPSPQPRPVPSLGIQPATLLFSGRRSIHQTTPARAKLLLLSVISLTKALRCGLSFSLDYFPGFIFLCKKLPFAPFS